MALFASVAHATTPADAPASDASIRELMTIANARAMLDQVSAQMEPMMKDMMRQATAGLTPTADQQKIEEDMRSQMVTVFKEEMNWDLLEPMYLDIYRKSFTQGEIDGMLDFYKSPAGKALIAKMPLVMQNSMVAMQDRMKVLIPKIQQVVKDYTEKLQAAGKPAPAKP